MSVIYTFYLDNAGEPATGLTPSFDSFINLSDLNANPNQVSQLPEESRPDIVELTDGFYYFSFDWDSTASSSFLIKINCGDQTNFANPEQRFIIMRLDRNDNLADAVNTIQNSSDAITTATGDLLKSVNRLLEIEQGTWKIEEENGEFYLNLYPTTDKNLPAASPIYDNTLTVDTVFAKYKLLDINDLSTATNPFKRIQEGIITPL